MRRDRLPGKGIHHLRRGLELAAACIVLAGAGSCMTARVAGAAKPAEAPPTFDEAIGEYYHGSFEKSVDILEKLIAADPLDRRARWEIVRELEEAGEYGRAVAALRDTLTMNRAAVDEELFVDLYLAGKLEAARELLPLPVDTAHSLFYEALLFRDLGDSSRAIALLHQSLSLREWHPMAWYFLGRLQYATKSYASAQESFERVLKQDPDLTMALVPLADSILAQGDSQAAYPLLLRARNILPGDSWIAAKVAELEQAHPHLAVKRAAANALVERTTVPPRVAPSTPAVAASPLVRVGLAEELRSITLKTGGEFVIRSAAPGGVLTYSGGKDQVLVVRSDAKEITLSEPGEAPFLTWTAPVSLEYSDPRCTTVVFNLVTERGTFFAATKDPAYRGAIEFRPDRAGFAVVNVLPLEEYLYAVLPSEMPAFWPMEALKAQAVAARSYTLASLGTFASRGFDVQGSVVSAAYGGVGEEREATTEAVNATHGQILVHDGRPLMAFYSANSGGYTEDSRVVWGESAGMEAVPDVLTPKRDTYLPLPSLISWLRSDPSSYSAVSPYYSRSAYRWVKWVPAEEIARRVGREKELGTILSIITRGRGISGRVTAVEVIGTAGSRVIRGDRIRAVLGGLRSTLFTVRPKLGPGGSPRYFIFTGGGWGHGVGMDQSGAAGMAAKGFGYREILAHYYPRARLEGDVPGATRIVEWR